MVEQTVQATHTIAASSGYWERAETRDQALTNLAKRHGWSRGDSVIVTIYRTDPEAFIDEWARIHHKKECPPIFEGTFRCKVGPKKKVTVGESI